MNLDVTAELTIARPIGDVARYAIDPSNDTAWISGIKEAEPLSPPPTSVGSRTRRIASFLGRKIEYVLEVAELEPERRIVMRSIQAPFPMVVTYEFEPAGSGTRARIRIGGEVRGFYRLAGPALSGAVRRSIGADLRAMKRILEGPHRPA